MAKRAAENKFFDICSDSVYERSGENLINVVRKDVCAPNSAKPIKTNGNVGFLTGINEAVDMASQLEKKAQSILDLSV